MLKNKIKYLLTICSTCVLSLLSACSTAMVDQISGPALLAEQNSTYTQIISQAMSLALNGRKVSLIANAFQEKSQHTLEKRSFTNANSNAVDGLILGIPMIHRFSLFSDKGSCYLTYEKTGQKYPLNGVKCKVL